MPQPKGTNLARNTVGKFSGAARLTPRQVGFVREYVRNGGNGAAAAREAGYSQVRADRAAWELLGNPRVIEAVYLEALRRAATSGVIAIDTLTKLARDETQPASARVNAAAHLLRASRMLEANPAAAFSPETADMSNGSQIDYAALLAGVRHAAEETGNLIEIAEGSDDV